MSVIHYWGAAAIARRLGYKNPKSFYLAYKQGRVAAFRRRDPRDTRRLCWYSNESLILVSELTIVRRQALERQAEAEAKQTGKQGAPRRVEKQDG